MSVAEHVVSPCVSHQFAGEYWLISHIFFNTAVDHRFLVISYYSGYPILLHRSNNNRKTSRITMQGKQPWNCLLLACVFLFLSFFFFEDIYNDHMIWCMLFLYHVPAGSCLKLEYSASYGLAWEICVNAWYGMDSRWMHFNFHILFL